MQEFILVFICFLIYKENKSIGKEKCVPFPTEFEFLVLMKCHYSKDHFVPVIVSSEPNLEYIITNTWLNGLNGLLSASLSANPWACFNTWNYVRGVVWFYYLLYSTAYRLGDSINNGYSKILWKWKEEQ